VGVAVSTPRLVSWVLLYAAVAAGTMADRPAMREPMTLGGYRLIAADFHVHSSTWSDGALTPWGLVLEARRQGLDAIAITGHNQVSDGQVGRWFSRMGGGPTVIVGQEILAPGHHVIALGTERVVDSRLSVAEQVDAVHAQGGVAIAAHPTRPFWPAFDAAAMSRLDGAEICHPLVFGNAENQRTLEQFAERGAVAAIGSSDFHGLGRLGMCRTYVFATDDSQAAILDAVRARRTVVYGPGGQAYGDRPLVQLAAAYPRLRDEALADPSPSVLDLVSRAAGLLGLLGVILTQASRRPAVT
jgi:predicted metal-dependent phosphoesterase TrpH